MAFQNYVCWDTSRVRQVLNTNAELASRHIFLAVHSEHPLNTTNPTLGAAQGDSSRTIQPDEFLTDFLSRDRPHVQVAVLGDSGSGKSHFISWMKYNLPETEDRYTIAIPRTGVSLRGVLELIIEALPEAEAEPYLDRLNRSGGQHGSPDDLEERLLSEIALAIRNDRVRGNQSPELEQALVEILPSIFHDPTLRRYFRQSGGIIEQLATQVLSASPDYSPADEPREFSTMDLPLSGVQTAEMARDARDTCDFLRSDADGQALAVGIINRNLDRAIGQVLDFTGDRLIALLQDVRRNLRKQGRELILLVEDLARLQGLDLSLLEALIEEGNQENGLCPLRWAAAVTTGYYSRLPDTVHTRMDYTLWMDHPTDREEGSIGPAEITAFAAKYLNAARAADDNLVAWAGLPEDERGDPPNACESCLHRTACHAAFGAHDGVGLYPFNDDSLTNMLRRLDPRFGQRFNPRVLIKDVMAEVLGTYGEDLKSGRFPSQLLLSQMQGAQLPPIFRDRLQELDAGHANRQSAILELWGKGSPLATELPEGLYAAFGTPKPQLGTTLQRSGPEPPIVHRNNEEDEPQPRAASPADQRLEAIRAWGNGDRMQDTLVNYLRPRVFDSIVSNIDWDAASLVQTFFASPTAGAFRRDSLSFAGQLPQAQRRPVTLVIPTTDGPQERTEAAIALEGLYLFSRQGSWDFPGGRDLFAVYANCVERWSEDVLREIETYSRMRSEWDITSAAVEILTVGAALAGKAPRQRADDVGWLNALFTDWPKELPDRTNEWRRFYNAYANDLTLLRDTVRASTSGTKGGRRGQFIDPNSVIPTIKRVRRGWKLSNPPPEDAPNRQDYFGRLARLYNRIRVELPTVAAAEWRQSTEWATDWHDKIGADIKGQEAVAEIRDLIALALENGIAFNATVKLTMETALAELEASRLDNALTRAQRLLETNDPLKSLLMLGRGRGNHTGTAVKRMLPAFSQMLDQLEDSVANRQSTSGAVANELRANQAIIQTALNDLVAGLKVMEDPYDQLD